MSTTTEQQSSEGQAASVAFAHDRVTRASTRDTSSSKSSQAVLDANGRLSSAGAATSLKHARAQDLPSFPSQGGVSLASAGAAASLAENNKKSFEHWKPGEIPAANKAAIQAQDYEMDPLWQPEMSRAGSRAAIAAHRDTKSPDAIYTPMKSAHGSAAAGHALDSNYSPDAITQRDAPVSDQRKALMAATGAMAGSRRRAGSAPIKPQTRDKNTSWAMQAANSSHKAQKPSGEFTTGDPGFEAARIQNTARSNVNRQMYTSNPPVSIEVQEKNRQDMLRASAIAMARKMYTIQQAHIDEAKGAKRSDTIGARAARNRATSDASAAAESPNQYGNLEEAARKLAQERLAKLHDEHAEYRQYYGAQPTSPPKSKLNLTMRGRRNRASNRDRDSDSDSDEEQSRRIRSQMSIFQSKLAEVDKGKRQADRDALLEAAHKNVTKQMNAIDEKVFKDTGKISPQQRELWERQARERAQRDSDDRMVNVGKVHIGGGKFMDQADIDAIAKTRLQPTLDDITEKAEKQRARDEEIRLEQERVKREAETEKQRQREIQQGIKQNQQKEKAEEKARRDETKRVQREEAAAAKEKRQAEEAIQKEKVRAEKEEKRKSKENKGHRFGSALGSAGAAAGGGTGVAAGATAATAEEAARPETADADADPERSAVDEDAKSDKPDNDVSPSGRKESWERSRSPSLPSSPEAERKDEPTSPISPPGAVPYHEKATEPTSPKATEPTSPGEVTSPTSPKGDSKVKSWFKSRFRSSSKAQNDVDDRPDTAGSTTVAAATRTDDDDKDEEKDESGSMRDVAMAGRKDSESEDMYGDANEEAPVSPVKDSTEPAKDSTEPVTRDRSPSISSMSSYGDKSSPEQTKTTAEETKATTTVEEPKTSPEPSKASTDAPSRMSTERPPSENTSDTEKRGRPGFRQRLLSKVKRDKNKNKDKNNAIVEEPAEEPTVEQQAAAVSGFSPMPESETKETTDKEANDTADKDTTPATTTDKEATPAKTEDEGDDEARDTFAEEKLAPPPKLADASGGGSPTRGSRERSRFTEDL